MLLNSFFRYLDAHGPRPRAQRSRRRAAHKRSISNTLFLEHLEERALLSFVATLNIDAGHSPRSVAVGDFNSDGIPDFAVANFGDDLGGEGVTVHLGNGDGTFQAARTFATGGHHPASVAVGDFNGDGVLDLAVANRAVNPGDIDSVSVLLGNGDGSFQAPRIYGHDYGIGNSPVSVVVGDFNGDGIPDLAVANGNGSNISVLLGNGDGTFQPGRFFLAGRDPNSVAVGDFNGDGALDLAVANFGTPNVSVLLGNGDGTFQAPRNLDVGTRPTSVAVADFDGDSNQDLVVANYISFPGNVSVLLGNGDGTFQAARTFAAGPTPISVAVGEFNGDGIQDLAVANYDDASTVSVLLGNGDGTFQTARPFAAGAVPFFVAVADLNRDGLSDLLVANFGACCAYRDSGASVSVLLGMGDGTFQVAPTYPTGNFSRSVAVGDFNGDGVPDLAVANDFGVSVLLGNGDGAFQAARTFAVENYPGSVVVGDFNGDGLLDLAVADNGGGVSVLLGNGDGTFQAARTFPAGRYPQSVAVGDFNGDGTLDLAVANYGYPQGGIDGSVSVLLGNGDGSFQAAHNFNAGTGPSSVAVGDFNGDGTLDLAVANEGSANVSVLLGNGDGTFQAARTFLVGNYPSSVAVGDFNGDGFPDLAVANGGTVSVLLGNGNGTFQPAVNYAAGSYPASVAVGDFNGDGVLDLAVANPSPIRGQHGSMRVLRGNGDGTFQTTSGGYVVGIDPAAVAVGDFNGDGWPDLVSANKISNDVSVLLNDSNWPGGRAPGGGSQPHRSLPGPLPRDDRALLSLMAAHTLSFRPESAPPTPAAGVAPRASVPPEPAVRSLDQFFTATAAEQPRMAFSGPRALARDWMEDWLAASGLILDSIGIGAIRSDNGIHQGNGGR